MKIIILTFLFLTLSCQKSDKNVTNELVAYFPEWAVEHQPYYVKHIERTGAADLITVLDFAFALPAPDSLGRIGVSLMNPYYDYEQRYAAEMSIDGVEDKPLQRLRGHLNQLKKLKKRHPNIKVVVSIGGWLGSVYFSDALQDEESRQFFTDALMDMFFYGNLPLKDGAGGSGCAKGIFDGIDIDWEFPVRGGVADSRHRPEDKDNLSKFYALLREKLDDFHSGLLLTAALPAKDDPGKIFNLKQDTHYLDWYQIMTYDFYGSWAKRTGHLSNLLTSPVSEASYSFDAAIRLFLDAYGIDGRKLIPGVAFYGRSWKNVDSSKHGFNQKGTTGPGIYEAGFNYYSDIMKIKNKGYQVHWDELSMAETMYNPVNKTFWTYDEPQSLALKASYVEAFKLRGMMLWDITGDDSSGTLIHTLFSKNMPDAKLKHGITNNQAPILTLKYFRPDSIIHQSSNIILSAEVRDIEGLVVKVMFYVDEKLIGYDSKPPFSWVWFNCAVGGHKLLSVAVDDRGKKTISNKIAVRVY